VSRPHDQRPDFVLIQALKEALRLLWVSRQPKLDLRLEHLPQTLHLAFCVKDPLLLYWQHMGHPLLLRKAAIAIRIGFVHKPSCLFDPEVTWSC
jgi:hypothetical protein